MIKFINGFTHTEMWVSEDRVEEYKAAGHQLAAEPTERTEEPKKPAKKPTAKKK